MSVGLSLPVGVSKSGSAKIVEGEENNNKIISLALGSDDNENAFNQNIGLGDFMVFEIEDPAIRGKIINVIRKLFRNFQIQKRFRLLTDTIEWKNDSVTQELMLEFKYHDLESDDIYTFSKIIKAGTQ
jgi:hypothetical protein